MKEKTEKNTDAVNNSNFCEGYGGNFVKENRVFILGDFDSSISQEIIPNMINVINSQAKLKFPEIEIYINSYGGNAKELLGLLTVISMAKKRGIKIVTYNIGVAYSCGSILFIHGDERKMFRHASMGMHLGYVSSYFTTFEQLDRVTTHNKKWFNTIVHWYVTNTKMKKDMITKILKDDKYHMDAAECLKYGFCDEVL